MAETTALQTKMKFDTAEVTQTRSLKKGYKVTSVSGSGTVKLNKVSSYWLKKAAKAVNEGKAIRGTIISNLEDPEAFGGERVRLKDCIFTEVPVADWEAGKLGEESIPFNFSDFDVLDAI